MAEKRAQPRSSASSSTDVNSDHQRQDVQHVEKDATQTEGQYELDPVMNKRVVRKCDRHIIPWLFGIWLWAFIDRSNIGNARIDGLTEDLGMKGTQFNVALVVFYIPYILVDVPSNWVVKYFKAGRYLPFLITGWGLVRFVFPSSGCDAGLLTVQVRSSASLRAMAASWRPGLFLDCLKEACSVV